MDVYSGLARCRKPQSTIFSWMAPVPSAGGARRRSSLTIPVDGCGFWTTATRQWRRKPPSREPSLTVKCIYAPPKESGFEDLKRGWLCCPSCRNWPGSAGSQACRLCAGLALPCTGLSRGIVTAFLARPHAARAIRVLVQRIDPIEAPCRAAWYDIHSVTPVNCFEAHANSR